MKKNKSNNGLRPLTLKTAITPDPAPGNLDASEFDDPEKIVQEKFAGAPSFAIFYLNYGIRFARWKNNAWEFHNNENLLIEHLQMARIFNTDRELKIWRDENGFSYRLRCDEVIDENSFRDDLASAEQNGVSFAIDAWQNLWGTRVEGRKGDWTYLKEDRGTEIWLPIPVSEIKGKYKDKSEYRGQLACLKTRNYIETLPNGQSSYVDCRFVVFRARTAKEVGLTGREGDRERG